MDNLIKDPRFKVGQAILFINGYGMSYNENFMWKYGEVLAGFVTSIEYIEAQNNYMYTVGTRSPLSNRQVMYRILGEHMIFSLDEESRATLKMKDICEKPDYE